ncbi:hypothetical protein B0H14DRAFT_1180397, partial [Mycena olivaceomarginata]
MVMSPGTSGMMNINGGTGGSGGVGFQGGTGGAGGVGIGPTFSGPFTAQKITITDPKGVHIIQANEGHMLLIKEKLANHLATKHEHTDQSKSLCAANTRMEIQADIKQWLSPQPSNCEHIFWITGIAGSGKSTLSATIVDNLRKEGTPVAAQFFISRNIPETIDPSKIIPTLAKQLAEFSPAAAHIIHDTLKKGFPPSRKEQVDKLLLAPIRELSKSGGMIIIIIDALDELQNADESAMEILSPIATRNCDIPDNVRFVVTSRPEHWADISRSNTLELAAFKQHILTTESSIHEVHNFIAATMKIITPANWEGWPTAEQVSELSRAADGLFHYAATALQWIKEQIRKDGKRCRSRIFSQFTQMGIGQLEDLYRLVLTSFEDIDDQEPLDMQRRDDQLRGFKHVIGTILVLEEPLTIQQIIMLLARYTGGEVRCHPLSTAIPQCLDSRARLHHSRMQYPRLHKSFRDYIVGDHVPVEFRVGVGPAHLVAANSCLGVIVKEASPKYCQYWHHHLRKAIEEGATHDGGVWKLVRQMVEEVDAEVWAEDAWNVFLNVATAAWELLEKNGDREQMNMISGVLTEAKVSSQTSNDKYTECGQFCWFSGSECFPLVAHACIFFSLTSTGLLVSRKCVLSL